MDNISIEYDLASEQERSWIRDQIDEYSIDMAYCPMCELLHENNERNSNCQRND